MTEQPPYQPPGPPTPPPPGQYGYAPPPTSSKAVTALILGILGLVFCGPFTAIPAIFVGRSATREIDASQRRLDGRGMATAGFVLGIVGTVLTVLVVIGFIALLALGGVLSNEFDETCTPTGSSDGFSVSCE
jgi:hypothetical protein